MDRCDTEIAMADVDTTNTNQPTQPTTQPDATTTQTAPLTWDTWAATFNDEQKTLIDAHISGLKKPLEQERESRKALEKQVKDLAGKADKGSELAGQLEQLQAQLITERQRADFVLGAPTRGVTNVAAAWKLAQADGLIGKDGEADWEKLQTAYPELFAKPQPPTPPKTNGGERSGEGPKLFNGMTAEQMAAKYNIPVKR